MILDSGLDNACTDNSANKTSGTPRWPYFAQFVSYACFGTGSTAPAANQTTLDAQVGSRTADQGGFADADAGGLDAGTNTIWYEGTFTRVFSIAGNVNAAEWGLAPATTGNLSVRELFRADPLDNNSSPITLTLEAGDQLQLVVTLRVEATWEYEQKSFVITGTAGNDTNGTHTGNATISSGASSTTDNIAGALGAAWPGGATSTSYERLYAYLTDQPGVGKSDNLGGTTEYVSSAAEPYTPGAHFRDWTATFSTSTANGDIHALLTGFSSRGYRFILTNPASLTKQNTHRLTLTVRKHISRL